MPFYNLKNEPEAIKMCNVSFINKFNMVIVGKSLWCEWNKTLQPVGLYKNNPLWDGSSKSALCQAALHHPVMDYFQITTRSVMW